MLSGFDLKYRLLNEAKDFIGRTLSKKEIEYIEATDESVVSLADFSYSMFSGVKSKHGLVFKNDVLLEKINRFFLWIESLQQYDDVYIIANSKDNNLSNIIFKETDLVVVFNRFQHESIGNVDCDVVVINRQIGKYKLFHENNESYLSGKDNVKYLAVSDYFEYINVDDLDFLNKYEGVMCADFIPYSLDKNSIPSTGYVFLYIVNHYFSDQALEWKGKCLLQHLL